MTAATLPEPLLDLIYDAAANPSAWKSVIEQMMPVANGDGAVLTRLDIANGTGSAVDVADDQGTLQKYFDYYYRINPLHYISDLTSYVKTWVPKVLRDEDWIARDKFEKSEFYNDFLRPIKTQWSVIIRLDLGGSQLTSISIGRSLAKGRFEDEEVATFSRLQAHLVRAYKLSERFASLTAINCGLAAGLDMSNSAMMLVDGDLRVLHANRAADRLLTNNSAIKVINGRLTAADARAASRLGQLALRTAGPSGSREGDSMQIAAPTLQTPLSISALPLSIERSAGFGTTPAAVLCFSLPSSQQLPSAQMLADNFGLTGAESRLAIALAQGCALRDAADRYEVSINTARSQLSSIFSKTGTNRQAELVRLLIQSRSDKLLFA